MEKGNTVAALNFEEKGGMVTNAHVSFRLQKDSQSTTVFLATVAALDPGLKSKKEDALEAQAMQSFFENMMTGAGKEATPEIGKLNYKGAITQKQYVDVYISPQVQ